MPTAPALPANATPATLGLPTNPMNFLMAAAEAHSRGDFQSAPVPTGKDLQTGKSKRGKITVVK